MTRTIRKGGKLMKSTEGWKEIRITLMFPKPIKSLVMQFQRRRKYCKISILMTYHLRMCCSFRTGG